MPDGLLTERVALVVGVGAELADSVASALAREGARLTLVGPSSDALAEVVDGVLARGGSALALAADLSQAGEGRRLVDTAVQTSGRIDVLVLGPPRGAPAAEGTVEADLASWRRAFETEVFEALALAQEVARAMRRQGNGSIVMIGAVEERMALEGAGPVLLARGALLSAARLLARELGPHGIRVNTVIPGWIEGPHLRSALAQRAAREGSAGDALGDRLRDEHALHRLVDASEVADAVVFFASDLSRIVTGQSLDVNCGGYFH
jgi:NAD(P)-dependent dehydrogenase (short-subunit alcohol dehydrogenase family)